MLKVKKVFLFVIIFCVLFVSSSFAVDIVTHPNNTDAEADTNITENINNDSTRSNTSSSSLSSSLPTVSTSSSQSQDTALTTSDIIDIIVVAVGIVNFLLGIAIILRFK